MKVLYPIHIDRWSNPISSKFREIITNTQADDIQFHTFSRPITAEDHQNMGHLWNIGNIQKSSYTDLLWKTFDLVHRSTATFSNHIAQGMANMRSGGKLFKIYTVCVEPHRDDEYYNMMKRALDSADYLLANSKAITEKVMDHFKKKIDHVIYNGVNVDFFNPAKANRNTLNKYGIEKPYYIYNSAILRRKRPDVLIEIAKKLPNINFVMIGRPTKLNKVYVKNLPSNIKYLGSVEKAEVRDLMCMARSLIFPSEIEGLPNAVLEAIAIGLPVIARNKSSLPELINERNGWLIDNDDLDSWIDLITHIEQMDLQNLKKFREISREETRKSFSWKKYAREHVDLYRSIR